MEEPVSLVKKPARRELFYGYVIVAAGFWIWLIAYGTYQSFGIFFKPLIAEFGWSRADTVMAFSLVSIVQALLAMVMGWLTDRLGPRIVITVLGSCLGIAYLLMSRLTSLWEFHAYYTLAAVGLSTASVPVMATLARWYIKKRSLMTGIVQAGVGVGGFIFAPLAAWLAVNYGWRQSYFGLGIITLISIFVCGLLMKRDPRHSKWLPDGEVAPPEAGLTEKGHGIQTAGLSLRQALHMRQYWIIIGIFFSFGFCRSTFLPHVAAYIQDIGFSLADGANVVAVLTVSSILGRLSMGRMGSRAAFSMAFGVTSAALAWGMLTRGLWGLYLFAFAFGVGWGAQAVLRWVLAAETFGLGSLGLLMGTLGFAESGAAAAGSYFAGWAFDVTGSYQPAFIAGIIISLTAVFLTRTLKSPSST